MASIERITGRFVAGALVLSLLAATGCRKTPADAEQHAPVVHVTPAVAKASDAPKATTTATPTTPAQAEKGVAPQPPADVAPPQPTVAAYTPPFPDRVDLFVPPKRQGGVRIEGEAEGSVELLGFIRLDRQRVVLSINGQITPIEEGASECGVEVISIQPPSVVLQRGRQRWQASLEN